MMDKKSIVCFALSMSVMLIYFIGQCMVLFGYIEPSYRASVFGMTCLVLFCAPFFTFAKRYHDDLSYKKKMFQDKMEAISNSFIVIVLNAKGTVLDANKNFENTFNVNKKDIIGKSHKCFSADPDYEKRKIWTHLFSGRSANGNFEKILEDGTSKWLSCSYVPVKNDSGFLKEVIVVAHDVTSEYLNQIDLMNKNKYLEHSAKILRHDMHSGINTYMPRGIKSLERRLPGSAIKQYKLEAPLKLLKDGLRHTQRVYEGVKAFTNIVKEDSVLERENHSLEEILRDYFSDTAYSDQIAIGKLPNISVNKPLFCTAIDNLVRNGLKYNDSDFKMVAITMIDENHIGVIDNGRGMSSEDFKKLSRPYYRKENQVESGSGLGLNITVAILNEHGFGISVEKQESGTLIKIRVKS